MRENHPMREKATRSMSPFLAWGDFHVSLRFACSTIPEEKWGTTHSLEQPVVYISPSAITLSLFHHRLWFHYKSSHSIWQEVPTLWIYDKPEIGVSSS